MSYLESYLRVVNNLKIPEMEKSFAEQGIDKQYGVVNLETDHDAEGLPFLVINCDYRKMSLMGGGPGVKMFVVAADFSGRFREFLPDFTCLPCLLKSTEIPEDVKEILDPDISLEYELMHINKLVNLYDENPDMQGVRFTSFFSDCRSIKEFRISVSMVLREFFHLEPEALEFCYDRGQRMVFDFFAGRIIYFPAESKKEYIQSMLAGFIYEIECRFNRAAEEAGVNSGLFRDIFNIRGSEVYGPKAYKKYSRIRSLTDEKLIDYSMENNPGILEHIRSCNPEAFCTE